jgi:dinuclear metal center YbgI/SA1388 family protein
VVFFADGAVLVRVALYNAFAMSRPFADVITYLKQLAPLEWAEPWDNVGLLVEPEIGEVERLLLTIDLTENVLREARSTSTQLIVAYHPIIFSGLKRLTRQTANERIVQDALRSNIAIYSPHTALDAAPGGMNDWLAQAVGSGSSVSITANPGVPVGVGMGRIVEMDTPQPLSSLVPMIKQHLGLSQLRVAAADRHSRGELIGVAAVCAGAGGSIFEHCGAVDLLLTGEMRHHDILERVAAGTSVIVADHTNTERGYLPHLAVRLSEIFGSDIAVQIAVQDHDPLSIV